MSEPNTQRPYLEPVMMDPLAFQIPRSSYIDRLQNGTPVIRQLYEDYPGFRAEATLFIEGRSHTVKACSLSSKRAILECNNI